MTPEQKRIEELERQLAMQRDAMDAIADAVEELADAIDYSYCGVAQAVVRMKDKINEMKENTL